MSTNSVCKHSCTYSTVSTNRRRRFRGCTSSQCSRNISRQANRLYCKSSRSKRLENECGPGSSGGHQLSYADLLQFAQECVSNVTSTPGSTARLPNLVWLDNADGCFVIDIVLQHSSPQRSVPGPVPLPSPPEFAATVNSDTQELHRRETTIRASAW